MYIEFFSIPIDLTYETILDTGSRDSYCEALRTKWRNTFGKVREVSNMLALRPQMTITTTIEAMDSTYCLIGEELNADGYIATGDFYFIRNATIIAKNSCAVELITDLYHNYIRPDYAPAQILRGVTQQGHRGLLPNYAPYALPIDMSPAITTPEISAIIPTQLYRLIVNANTDEKQTYAPDVPSRFMSIASIPYTYSQAIYVLSQLANYTEYAERGAWEPSDIGYNPFNIVNYTNVYLIPANWIQPASWHKRLDIKFWGATDPIFVQPVTYQGTTIIEYPTHTEDFTIPDSSIDMGDACFFGTFSHMFPITKSGQDNDFKIETYYTDMDGFRVLMHYSGDVIDITEDFAVPYLNTHASAYWEKTQTESNIQSGIMTAIGVIGGAIATGGASTGALVAIGVGAASAGVSSAFTRAQQARKPYIRAEGGNGILNARYGGIFRLDVPAGNKADIVGVVEAKGVLYTYKEEHCTSLYPEPSSRGYEFFQYEDINLNIAAPSEIREQCNQIFTRGTTIYTDYTKL